MGISIHSIKKWHFVRSVRDLFIDKYPAGHLLHGFLKSTDIFSLLRRYTDKSDAYQEVQAWEKFFLIAERDIGRRYMISLPKTLKIVMESFANNLNKYEAAALVICDLVSVDTDKKEDVLNINAEEEASEYSRIYALFDIGVLKVWRALNGLAELGNIRKEVQKNVESAFGTLFEKYPELRLETPPKPVEIEWWELIYSDSNKEDIVHIGRFMRVSDMTDLIVKKEGEENHLFWEYPFKRKYSDWKPMVPPNNEYKENSLIAIPKRGWEKLWKEYEGIVTGSRFDHWEAKKRKALVRAQDKVLLMHNAGGVAYQGSLNLEKAV